MSYLDSFAVMRLSSQGWLSGNTFGVSVFLSLSLENTCYLIAQAVGAGGAARFLVFMSFLMFKHVKLVSPNYFGPNLKLSVHFYAYPKLSVSFNVSTHWFIYRKSHFNT